MSSSSTTARPTGRRPSPRSHGAGVLSFGENRGLREGIAAGYATRASTGTRSRARRRRRPASRRRAGAPARDRPRRRGRRRGRLAVRDRRWIRGLPLRAVAEQEARDVRPAPSDEGGTRSPLPRRDERHVRGQRKALPHSASRTRAVRPRSSRSSVSAKAGLRVVEVPVDMRERASGESKLRGRKAARLVITVVGHAVSLRRLAPASSSR